ncbi:spore coat protein GerQ [Sporosarcina limicola]|uniref:Spore germination protein Q n=1 Tax=Sporosarcina limicola TaxID=34101 RepID=A0A927ME83_9BACL|nr:spore coat protein GerQ [Sporosarcina limicola]MBE1552935.1 spore germination protein Q [Sporosarcina limicola]
MVQYYWNPNFQQQQQQMIPPQVTIPSGRPPGLPQREESYIENILRLNRGQPGTFHFSFEHALDSGKNTKTVRGVVEAAGRDHVILSEPNTGHRFLFPMIYFDYAEFDNEVKYFTQQP